MPKNNGVPSIQFDFFIRHFGEIRKNGRKDTRPRLLEVYAGKFKLKMKDKAKKGRMMGEIVGLKVLAISWSSKDESIFCKVEWCGEQICFTLPTRHESGIFNSYCAVGQIANSHNGNIRGRFVRWSARVVNIQRNG